MRKHVRKCWGDETVASADSANNANEVRATTVKGVLDSQSIMAAFKRKGKGKVTFSHQQHTTTESRAKIVRWVAESKGPLVLSAIAGSKA